MLLLLLISVHNFQVIYFICFYSDVLSFQHGALLPFSVTFWPGSV